jgi:thiol-disulfide isomerase/thioredoxin
MINGITGMRLHPLLFLLVLLSSCSDKKENFKIEGNVEGAKDVAIYLFQRSLSGTFPVDSAVISGKGTFKLRGFTDQPNFYILFIQKDQYINLLIHPGDKIHILTKAVNFNRDYFVEGSKDSRLILKLVSKQAGTLDRITELSNEYENSLDRHDLPQIKARLDSMYNIVFFEHKQFSIDFVRENKTSLVSLMALYQQVGRQSPVFDYEEDFELFAQVDSALFPRYPESEAVKDLNKKVNQIREMRKVAPGSPAPPLDLPDSNGKPFRLSELRGRVVLVNFWASWSDASMAANKSLSEIYDTFHPKGFEVVQVSLDRTRESWLMAIKNDRPDWIHVSDLAYWDSPVVRQYRIESLPANCLVDAGGIIVARNCMGQELRQKLTEILH